MKLIIFDLDGTLLNTLQDLSAAANAALKACGFPMRTEREIQHFVGNGVSKLLERALPDGEKTPDKLARLKESFFAYYDAHLWTHTVPYWGIEDVLQELTARNVQLAVASNKYQSATERLVKHFFPHIPFAVIFGQRPDVPTKPNPQIVFDILRACGVQAANALYVGDSAVDMQTAHNAGVRACGVAWGFRPEEELITFNPLLIAKKPHEILSLFH